MRTRRSLRGTHAPGKLLSLTYCCSFLRNHRRPGTPTRSTLALLFLSVAPLAGAPHPVKIQTLAAPHAMVVAGHPQAAAIGVEILRDGGNAIDAAVAVSLALGVAEPYGSGLGGKLMLLYHDAATERTFAVDGMDAAGTSLDGHKAAQWTSDEYTLGWRSVAVPGSLAGLELAHAQWGKHPWPEVVEPAVDLARRGFAVLPKTRMLFEERIDRIRSDAALRALYLPENELPEIGQRLPNPDLAVSLELIARDGSEALYHGSIAEAIVLGAEKNGGVLTKGDLATYAARIIEPIDIDLHGHRVVAAPPPTTGAALSLPVLAALEPFPWPDKTLRSAANLERLASVWSIVNPIVYQIIGDDGRGRKNFENLLGTDSITAIRRAAGLIETPQGLAADILPAGRTQLQEMLNNRTRTGGAGSRPRFFTGSCEQTRPAENPADATTHFVIVDPGGNIVCATQSLSYHFGAGVVAPGTGIILNNSMSNFAYRDPESPNFVAPGQRPRSTIAPMIIFQNGHPRIALGLPGGSRIPTAMLQVLLDHLVFGRSVATSMADTRFHINPASRNKGMDAIETENGLEPVVITGLEKAGWTVEEIEPAGTGLRFGGFAAIEFLSDGTRIGHADTRRTNAAAGF